MQPVPALGRLPRFVAAALAAGVTWIVFGAVVSLGSNDHDRLVAAIAARQPSATAVAIQADAPLLVAAAPAP